MRVVTMLAAVAALWAVPAQAVTYYAGTLDPGASLLPNYFLTDATQTDTIAFDVSSNLDLTVVPISLGALFGVNVSVYKGDVGSGALLGGAPGGKYTSFGSVSAGNYYVEFSALTSLNGQPPANPQKYQIQLLSNYTRAVPEPSTWAMMVIGIGLVGFGLRRYAATPGGQVVPRAVPKMS